MNDTADNKPIRSGPEYTVDDWRLLADTDEMGYHGRFTHISMGAVRMIQLLIDYIMIQDAINIKNRKANPRTEVYYTDKIRAIPTECTERWQIVQTRYGRPKTVIPMPLKPSWTGFKIWR